MLKALHLKIARICIDKEHENQYRHSELAIVELESSFPNMDNFRSPLWSQPNEIFYPQDGSTNCEFDKACCYSHGKKSKPSKKQGDHNLI